MIIKAEFDKFVGYKINMQKSAVFLYTAREIRIFLYTAKEIKKAIPLMIAPKGIKYLEITLTKEVKDLYLENFKMLMKKKRYK